MEKALMLAAIIGPYYLILGLSFLMYAGQWKKVVEGYEKNHFAWLPFAAIAVILGVIIINMYNVWEWNLYVVITLTGWVALLKGVFYFLAPGSWIKKAMRCRLVSQEGFLYFWGALFTVLGILLTYNAYWT
ncbi:hypothetical protein JW752_04085 [Candidatus Peregrinibacteria bacterium]|nr:hypothetical protein [Candidatus Peregrinibacteria bacterium]